MVLGISLVTPVLGKVGFTQTESYSEKSIKLAQAEAQNTSREAEIERANQLSKRGVELYQQGKYTEAIAIFEQVVKIKEDLFVGDHPDKAASLNSLAFLYKSQNRYIDAEPLLRKALAMRRRLYDGDHADLAVSIAALAVNYNDQGKYTEAEPLFLESLEMSKRLFPYGHSSVAVSLGNLAELYRVLGKYEEAETFNQEALEMLKNIYQGDHSTVIVNLNNLAFLYIDQGKYVDAEFSYTEAISMAKRLFEDDHPNLALSILGLGTIYHTQGRYTEAEPLYSEALAMTKRLFKGDHPYIAVITNNLAKLHHDQEKYIEAETLYKEALAMRKRIYRGDHLYVAASIGSLAALYQDQEKYSEAEPLYRNALTMKKRLFSQNHPEVAKSLNNLAALYHEQGKYLEAEPLYRNALAIRKRLLSQTHPDVALSLNNSGLFFQAQEKYPEALNYLTQAAKVEENILSENLVIGSEQQKKQFLDKFQGSTDTTISLHLNAIPENRQAAELALTTILRRKGRVLDAMGQTLQTLRDNLDDDSAQLLDDLTKAQSQLTAIAYKPLPNDPTQRKNREKDQANLDQQIKALEAKLSSRSAEFKQQTTPVTIAQVQQAISDSAALVEFIQYRPFDAKASTYSEPRYAVYVLMPNGEMQWQDLGEAAPIDVKIAEFRSLLDKAPVTTNSSTELQDDPYLPRGLGVQEVKGSVENKIKQAARELDQLLMQPVRAMTGDATHLLLSPDSQLNTLPFAALVDEDDNYLVQNYLITYLTSGRDLLRLQLNQDQPTTDPLLFANPDYVKEGIASKENSDKRGRRSAELSSLNDFAPLSGTKAEGEAISKIVPQLKIYTETAASENNLKDKQNQNPEFLHLATHGFFLAPEEVPEPNPRNSNPIDNQPVFSTAENPLLRSGLALAGFNQRKSGTEDGVLTALEVTGLNLRGTKLVVTSACETGLGDVQAGEGIYGLRRAFTLAGAQSQLMSLWKVSDDGTKDLMVEYYSRIQNGEARGEALRQVQLEMLESKDRDHPFYWAAFIPSGSWLPLNSNN